MSGYQYLPPLGEAETEALRSSIETFGVLHPVTTDEAGDHPRASSGIDYPTVVLAGLTHDQKIETALTLNLGRRHLSVYVWSVRWATEVWAVVWARLVEIEVGTFLRWCDEHIAGKDPYDLAPEILGEVGDLVGGGGMSLPRIPEHAPEVESGTGSSLVVAASIEPARVTWLWEGRIPARMGTLIAGRGGAGKTALVGWIMARLTRGQLPGDWYGRPAHVVYVGAEDDPASVLVPRLIAAGADLSRVHLHVAPASFTAADATGLADELAGLPDVAMVVIDPLDADLGGSVDTHRKAEVQAATASLVSTLTGDHPCGVVGVAHLSKGDGLDVVKRIIGSVGFTTSARSVLAVGDHPEEPRDRLCVAAKQNMVADDAAPALRYRVETVTVEHPDGGDPIGTAGVVIVGEEHGVDPSVILAVSTAAERTERDEAVDWLRELLDDGPMRYRDVESAAREEGIARATLHRARRDAGVVVDRDESARGRPSTWRLSSHGISSHARKETGETKSNGGLTCDDASGNGVSSHVSPLLGAETISDRCEQCDAPGARLTVHGRLCPACAGRVAHPGRPR